jgi:tRNA (guanine-N7-)-methyltransferase
MNSFVAPQNLIIELRSILEPLSVTEYFPKAQPLEIELGCGDASFLLNYAKAHPDRNFIGVERLGGRINKLDRKGRRAGLTNLRGVRIESGYFLEYLVPPRSASALHIYFPDPWPKRKHLKNRFINDRFPQIAQRVLTPNGIVYLRTDHEDYFEQMTTVFATASKIFRPIETPEELSTILTDFEADFHKQGIQTRRAAYELVK